MGSSLVGGLSSLSIPMMEYADRRKDLSMCGLDRG